MFNRHFIILFFCVVFIGTIVWWQKPDSAIVAITQGKCISSPQTTIETFYKRMDTRQFDLAKELIAMEGNNNEVESLIRLLDNNPYISIQNINIKNTNLPNKFIIDLTLNSIISSKSQLVYETQVDQINNEWYIISLKPV